MPAPVTVKQELLAEALGDRYSLERELSRGGMAAIYLARERLHGQPVAIKVMHPSLALAVGAERFLREIEILKSLAHPLIVPLCDAGGAEGLLYYVMPYLEGESLSQRLERERRLSVESALQVTHDVAGALSYAHSHGVLHRDVKPENILLAGGHALIADFGLAQVIGAADSHRLTQTGIVVGTAYYLSPEQLAGERELDPRTDIYSLGCVLYEMLTGGPPYTGGTLTQLVAQILRAPIPSVRRVDPSLPATVDDAIGRALAKNAAARFATMEEFAAAVPPADGGSGSRPTSSGE